MPFLILLIMLAVLASGCGGSQRAAAGSALPAGSASDEHLAWWGDGDGQMAETVASRGAAIPQGAEVRADSATRLYLAGCPGSTILLSPDSRCRLLSQQDSLIIDVLQGQLALDLADRGPWQQVLVRGERAEAVVLGTLLNTERTAQGDFFMLVRGRVTVRLRAAIAAALGRPADDEVELGPRQAVSAGETGLGGVDTLRKRPQLGTGTSLQQQAAASAGGGWASDALARQMDGLDPGLADDLSADLGQELQSALAPEELGAEDLNESLSDSLLPELDDFPGQPSR